MSVYYNSNTEIKGVQLKKNYFQSARSYKTIGLISLICPISIIRPIRRIGPIGPILIPPFAFHRNYLERGLGCS